MQDWAEREPSDSIADQTPMERNRLGKSPTPGYRSESPSQLS